MKQRISKGEKWLVTHAAKVRKKFYNKVLIGDKLLILGVVDLTDLFYYYL